MSQSNPLSTPTHIMDLAEKDLDFAFMLMFVEERDNIDESLRWSLIKDKYDKQTARRLYVRMFISLVESVLFTLKSEVLTSDHEFSHAEIALLEDKTFELSDKGEAIKRPYYGSTERNLIAVSYRVYGMTCGGGGFDGEKP